MQNFIRALPALALAFTPIGSHASCSCQCVDGAPRTICTELDEAATNPSLCGLEPPLCSPVGEPTSRARFDPPPGARDCREAALADTARDGGSVIVKVCEPLPK
jgi:hypothetical protein